LAAFPTILHDKLPNQRGTLPNRPVCCRVKGVNVIQDCALVEIKAQTKGFCLLPLAQSVPNNHESRARLLPLSPEETDRSNAGDCPQINLLDFWHGDYLASDGHRMPRYDAISRDRPVNENLRIS
jgi:hypothetical protein